jgi:hypothetical protein
MARFAVVVLSLVSLASSFAFPQTTTAASAPASTAGSQVLTLLQQSLATMTGGIPVSDVSLSGTASRFVGPDQQAGNFILEAKGLEESKISLSLSGQSLAEVHNFSDGAPVGSSTGSDGKVHELAAHNCFSDAAWFFPPLSSLAAALAGGNTNAALIGPETVNGIAVLHVRIWQSVASPDAAAVKAIAHLSAMDWYLNATSALPLAVRFTTHPPENASADLPVEIRFADYRPINGVLVPFHIQKLFNGGLMLDLTITSAAVNSGLSDADFTVQ